MKTTSSNLPAGQGQNADDGHSRHVGMPPFAQFDKVQEQQWLAANGQLQWKSAAKCVEEEALRENLEHDKVRQEHPLQLTNDGLQETQVAARLVEKEVPQEAQEPSVLEVQGKVGGRHGN